MILPSTPGEGKTTAGADAGSMPVRQNFRPPPGFMDNSGDGISTKEMSTDEMLRCLQAQSGHWYELATYLPKLQREGIDGSIVEEMTGIDRRQQNVWSNASMVYGSLRKGGKVTNLEYFDLAGTEYLLYELRFLSIDQRAKAANYIVEHELDPQESLVLARAIKEHERRKGEKEGFSDSPADCLAFKYYRDALENQGGDEMKTYIEKGLAVAETDAARETLSSAAKTSGVEVKKTAAKAKLDIIRLMKEEVGYRPIAVAGDLATLDPESLRAAPKVSSSGIFGNFTIPSDGISWEWMPLPSWSVLSLAHHPVAVTVKNCSQLKALREVSGVTTEKELNKLQGPGVIVVEIKPDDLDSETEYYLAKINGGVDLVQHSEITDKDTVLGKVLFLCRPPSRDAIGAATSEILSM